jgi:hypothetical protein
VPVVVAAVAASSSPSLYSSSPPFRFPLAAALAAFWQMPERFWCAPTRNGRQGRGFTEMGIRESRSAPRVLFGGPGTVRCVDCCECHLLLVPLKAGLYVYSPYFLRKFP